jgi:hypothetical protein
MHPSNLFIYFSLNSIYGIMNEQNIHFLIKGYHPILFLKKKKNGLKKFAEKNNPNQS